MSNQNNQNNLRHPPLRPNPNMARPRPQRATARPKPIINQNPNTQNVNQNNPTPQDMFSSLTQAYNNMINNLQFMNAVGIVSGIYQNASNLQNMNNMANMQNQFNPYIQQQMNNMNNMANMQNNSQMQRQEKKGEQSFSDNLNDKEQKQAFFDEFYSYLTNKMAKDNINSNLKNDSNQKEPEVKVVEKVQTYVEKEPEIEVVEKVEVVDKEPEVEVAKKVEVIEKEPEEKIIDVQIEEPEVEEIKETRKAVLASIDEGITLEEYLTKVCQESDFEQFSNPALGEIGVIENNIDYNLTVEDCAKSGESLEVQPFNVEELKAKIDAVKQAQDDAEKEELADGVAVDDEMQQIDKEIQEIEDSISSASKDEQELQEILDGQEEIEENSDNIVAERESFEFDDNNAVEDDFFEEAPEDVILDLDEEEVVENEVDLENENQLENETSLTNETTSEEEIGLENETQFEKENELESNVEDDNEIVEDDTITQDEELVASSDDEELSDNIALDEVAESISEDAVVQEEVSVEDMDFSDIIVDETGATLYNFTMTEKILNAEEDVQKIYNEIKNYLLSYKGIKARYSSACESFRLSRKLMAKFVIIGMTVKLYLALDPNSFPNNIYHQKDESKKKAYVDVPFMVKVKSNLSIRKAKELIDEMMTQNDVQKNFRYQEHDYIQELIGDGE